MASASATTSPRDIASSLNKLNITPASKRTATPADSWDAEDSDDDDGTSTPIHQVTSSDYPGPPPPTPSSPSFSSRSTAAGTPYQTFPPYGFQGDDEDGSVVTRSSRGVGEDKRPEKSTAVASRLIAAGIGQKAPRRTKEEREYDAAMRVQEKKKREQAKVEEERRREEKERARKAIWDD
ncbi:hypothetical protein LTR10_004218 [Elasticomyces elasticus]|nr:hypothetical protein LTR10_004218 [Elasticomyces elasticus]KAK4977600.1 hypothetical protein LTR42_001971 [Elasticomyces elasticus]